ncbi:MAG TPA: hypothetical protein VF322_08380 [Gammaproteobacteria bacterium]
MEQSAWPLVIYTGLALLVIVAIFLGAARFVNTAKKGNVRFKWGSRADRGRR